MVPKIEITGYLPASIGQDVRSLLARVRETSAHVRVISVPAIELAKVIEEVVKHHPYPFCPVLCGVPVEFGATAETIEIICVQDNNQLTASHRDGTTKEIAI